MAAASFATLLAVLLVLNLNIGNVQLDHRLQAIDDAESADGRWLMGSPLSPAFVAGNNVRALVNGEEIFPAMLAAITAAEATITLESYIYWSGDIGRAFSDALVERAASGVEVKVLLDWFGSDLDRALLDRMRDHGIAVRFYNELSAATLDQLNHRSHRRLMVVDGQRGFIGGAGLADQWSGDAQGPDHWRDTHFQVDGPVVRQLQLTFLDNWIVASGEVLRGPGYLPRIEPAGDMQAHVFSGSPGGGVWSVQLMYLLAIASAQQSIDLSAAYFIPDAAVRAALQSALHRGVRLRIIVPGPHMDQPVVTHASRTHWGALLEAGAEIHRYQPTMYHCKVMVVDARWVSVGSTNFDPRSFHINDEANLNVLDPGFAVAQTEIFERDLERSRQVTLADWNNRSWSTRALDAAFTLIDSQL